MKYKTINELVRWLLGDLSEISDIYPFTKKYVYVTFTDAEIQIRKANSLYDLEENYDDNVNAIYCDLVGEHEILLSVLCNNTWDVRVEVEETILMDIPYQVTLPTTSHVYKEDIKVVDLD